MKNSALLVTDVQNDFLPGGALGIKNGDKIIPVINKYIELFTKNKSLIIFSRDWHPEKTEHFQEHGGKWPPHCVQWTEGAKFHNDLIIPPVMVLVSKGTDPKSDSYSVFDAANKQGIKLTSVLKNFKINKLFVSGLATDYCVRASSKDALSQGLEVVVLRDAIEGVDIEDSQNALNEIEKLGGEIKNFSQVSKLF